MRYVVVGNSGAGKSTFARQLGQRKGREPVDLDEIYWEPDAPGVARPHQEAVAELLQRLDEQGEWIVEGCYDVLARALFPTQPVLVWLDPGEDVCVSHCRQRPWEPHKYPSRKAQDRNLAMLIDWVRAHYQGEGPMSYRAHKALFDDYDGPKHHLTRIPYTVEGT